MYIKSCAKKHNWKDTASSFNLHVHRKSLMIQLKDK